MDVREIPESEKTPLIIELLHIIQQQEKSIAQLKDEIARLKNQNPRPQITPSRLEKDPDNKKKENSGKRPGSHKRSKTVELQIHETKVIPPEDIPPGSVFERRDNYVVQGIEIRVHNILYQLECWRTLDGQQVKGQLPNTVTGHFDAKLISYILQQYYDAHVTQPLLLGELLDMGVDISSGQISRILTEAKDDFHREKDDILTAGLDVSNYIHVDDTGARHAGKNGYCTHIGNEFFAWFESTESKSRINFLRLLQAGHHDYVINADALDYIKLQSFPQALLLRLGEHVNKRLASEDVWKSHLEEVEIIKERHVRIATEGALLGSLLEHGFSRELAILSDDAGQFNVLLHALCWFHAERTINKIIPCSHKEKKAIADIRDCIWKLYRQLKVYKQAPDEKMKGELEKTFDEIFSRETCSEVLNAALQRLANNKKELLLVLKRPDIPLHNNLSERDIREYVKRRKISGGTRSDIGKRCRDTFTSLKKTCRKLGISFWDYLYDRVSRTYKIPPLPELIRDKARSP